MGNSRFVLRLVVWSRRLNNGVKHHGKRFGSGVRPANEEVQLGGGRVRSGGLSDIVQLVAIFAVMQPLARTRRVAAKPGFAFA
jgi:hypothetical protein